MERNDWDYEVALKELETVGENSQLYPNKKATVDVGTGGILGIVSPSYRLIQNKTIFELMQEAGEKLDLTLNSVSVCKQKSVTIFKYGFSDNKNKVVANSAEENDVIRFGIEIINSFDSSRGSGKFRAFANRLACLNGMTVPATISTFYFSDLKNFGRDSIQNELTKRITPICNTAEIWDKWAKIVPSRIKVGELISGNLGKGASKEILEKYDGGTDRTIWGLYNLLTYYISHEVKSTNPNDIRMRQYDLERVCNKFYEVDLL